MTLEDFTTKMLSKIYLFCYKLSMDIVAWMFFAISANN